MVHIVLHTLKLCWAAYWKSLQTEYGNDVSKRINTHTHEKMRWKSCCMKLKRKTMGTDAFTPIEGIPFRMTDEGRLICMENKVISAIFLQLNTQSRSQKHSDEHVQCTLYACNDERTWKKNCAHNIHAPAIYVHMISKMHVLDHWCVGFSQYQRALCVHRFLLTLSTAKRRALENAVALVLVWLASSTSSSSMSVFGGWMVRSHFFRCISECVRVYTGSWAFLFNFAVSFTHTNTD